MTPVKGGEERAKNSLVPDTPDGRCDCESHVPFSTLGRILLPVAVIPLNVEVATIIGRIVSQVPFNVMKMGLSFSLELQDLRNGVVKVDADSFQ